MEYESLLMGIRFLCDSCGLGIGLVGLFLVDN